MGVTTSILSNRGDVVLPIAPGAVDSTAIVNTVTTGITAGTTHTLAGAVPLTAQINNITVCATIADAVALPAANAAALGDWIVVINNGAAAAAVWPQAADKIDAIATGSPATVTQAKRSIFYCVALNTWVSIGTIGLST
jgi:hypothetical protein